MPTLTIANLRHAFASIEDLVFPPICAGCRRRGSWLCSSCLSELEPLCRPWCARCGQPQAEPSDWCARCAEWPVEIGSVRAAYAFGGAIREAIHRYKYHGEFARAPSLAKLVYQAIVDSTFDVPKTWDMVAYVPLHSRRRRKRGFDQSRLLARALAEQLDLPLATQLKRTIDTPTQVGLGETERQTNVQDAFAWAGPELRGARILVLDDVITTGATFLGASQPLIQAGATRIDGMAIAREVRR